MKKEIMVTRSSMPSMDEYMQEIQEIWETHWLTNMGIKHEQLKEQLQQYLDVSHLDLCTNGHMALELSMQALHLQGEVITTPFTFVSTTHAIVRNGLKPVFCDIDPIHFTMDPVKIEALITDRTCAIVPVHVYGTVCDVEAIEAIAEKYGLKIIYDAAHAFGETYKGKGIGNFGDVSCFSFHATKVFNTIEGGAVCYHDMDFGREFDKLRNFGIKDAEHVDGIGCNAKMNEFCAAMGLCNLRHVQDEIAKRKRISKYYMERLTKIPGLQLALEQKDVVSNYAYFPIVVHEDVFGKTRNQLCAALKEQGVFARKYFYPLTNAIDCYAGRFSPESTPIALHISNRILTLPLYADLDLQDADHICEVIEKLHQ